MRNIFHVFLIFLFSSCGAVQSIKNTDAVKHINIGMTRSEVESKLILGRYSKEYERLITNEQGERFIIRWYRIDFDSDNPTPFYYINDLDQTLIGYGDAFTHHFAAEHGFEIFEEELTYSFGSVAKLQVPMSRESKLLKELEGHDPYLAKLVSSYFSKARDCEQLRDNWNFEVEKWNVKFLELRDMESSLVKSMNIEQLEIYSELEEAMKGDSIAKKELYIRKLRQSLNDKQISIAENILSLNSELTLEEVLLVKYKDALDINIEALSEIKVAINNQFETIKREIKHNQEILAGFRASQPSGSQVWLDGLNRVGETLTTQAQELRRRNEQQASQFQMYQINNSLRDISNAIRGY